MSAIKQTHVDPAEPQILQFPGPPPARSLASSPEVKEDLRLVKQIAAGEDALTVRLAVADRHELIVLRRGNVCENDR